MSQQSNIKELIFGRNYPGKSHAQSSAHIIVMPH